MDLSVLVLAPWGRDAEVVRELLGREGIPVEVCADVESLCSRVRDGAGVALATEESLLYRNAQQALIGTLRAQEPWSEMPVVILTGNGVLSREADALATSLTPHANLTLLERPLREATLIAAVRAGLRARARQYEVRDLLDQERGLRAEAEASNRRKDAFLAMLGHELRNPLAAVRNAIAVASLDGGKGERALQIAQRQTMHLAHLVDDLVDVARVTQGKIRLRTERVLLATILERAVEATRGTIDERTHRLVVSEIPSAVLQGDPTRLEQVVVNLVGNASKYTSPGGTIRIGAWLDGLEAVIEVSDNGIGIAPDMLPRVFDLFAQGDDSLDRAEGGLGIGLTIVRQLVELHGGTIEARSDGLGLGARFVVRLPAEPVAASQCAPESASASLDLHDPRVLIVEDNPDSAESLRMVLELSGHRVRVANDGQEAMVVAQEYRPDIVLLDIGLPDMDGYEVARRLRSLPALERAVLIALTGYGSEDDRRRAIEAGFQHHITKPADVVVLDRVLRGAKKGGRRTPTLH